MGRVLVWKDQMGPGMISLFFFVHKSDFFELVKMLSHCHLFFLFCPGGFTLFVLSWLLPFRNFMAFNYVVAVDQRHQASLRGAFQLWDSACCLFWLLRCGASSPTGLIAHWGSNSASWCNRTNSKSPFCGKTRTVKSFGKLPIWSTNILAAVKKAPRRLSFLWVFKLNGLCGSLLGAFRLSS